MITHYVFKSDYNLDPSGNPQSERFLAGGIVRRFYIDGQPRFLVSPSHIVNLPAEQIPIYDDYPEMVAELGLEAVELDSLGYPGEDHRDVLRKTGNKEACTVSSAGLSG